MSEEELDSPEGHKLFKNNDGKLRQDLSPITFGRWIEKIKKSSQRIRIIAKRGFWADWSVPEVCPNGQENGRNGLVQERWSFKGTLNRNLTDWRTCRRIWICSKWIKLMDTWQKWWTHECSNKWVEWMDSKRWCSNLIKGPFRRLLRKRMLVIQF